MDVKCLVVRVEVSSEFVMKIWIVSNRCIYDMCFDVCLDCVCVYVCVCVCVCVFVRVVGGCFRVTVMCLFGIVFDCECIFSVFDDE